MLEGWDFRQFPHYWMQDTTGMFTTLCQERMRPAKKPGEEFHLRARLPRNVQKRCMTCAALAGSNIDTTRKAA